MGVVGNVVDVLAELGEVLEEEWEEFYTLLDGAPFIVVPMDVGEIS